MRVDIKLIRAIRYFFGLLFSPTIPSIIIFLCSKYIGNIEDVYVIKPILIIAYLATFIFGCPFIVFSFNKNYKLKVYLIYGVISGFISGALFILFLAYDSSYQFLVLKNSFGFVLFSIIYAAISSFLFWLFAEKKWN